MRCRRVAAVALLPVLLAFLAASRAGAAAPSEPDPTTEPAVADSSPASVVKAGALLGFGLGYGDWSGAGDFVPMPVNYIAENSGPFETDAIGLELTFHGRIRSASRVAWFVGVDLGSYIFENEESVDVPGYWYGDDWYDDDWDDWDEASLALTVSFVTASVRAVVAASPAAQLHLLAGLGAYYATVGVQSDDWGSCYCGWYSCCGDTYESTGNHDWSPGGYVGLGVGFPLGGVGGLRLDGRAHFFDFGQLGYLFPGQSANGPMYTFALVWDFGLR
jgi:hypothetical protein